MLSSEAARCPAFPAHLVTGKADHLYRKGSRRSQGSKGTFAA
ncbi:hypothetical protein HDF19_06135 [Mucilaginibacter sp. E4BP6]|nr:hypothetical protein [Mucilaginibacter sp. E4BP6]NYE68386.1 hypothetical protein [Mucilaginibacter sp. E4BP6]